MQEQNGNTNLFLKFFYYETSCYNNLPLFTLFVQKSMGSAQPMTHKEKNTSVTGVP